MAGHELSRRLATVEDTTLPITLDRQQQQQQQQQQQLSSTGNSIHPQHCTSTTGGSLMALQQQANMQTIDKPPRLPPLLHFYINKPSTTIRNILRSPTAASI